MIGGVPTSFILAKKKSEGARSILLSLTGASSVKTVVPIIHTWLEAGNKVDRMSIIQHLIES